MNQKLPTDCDSSPVVILVSLPNQNKECLDGGFSSVSGLPTNESIGTNIEINLHQLYKSASQLLSVPLKVINSNSADTQNYVLPSALVNSFNTG